VYDKINRYLGEYLLFPLHEMEENYENL